MKTNHSKGTMVLAGAFSLLVTLMMKWIRKNQTFMLCLAISWAATILAVPQNCFAQNFIEDRIRIDRSVRSGQDLKLAGEIERFLEKNLRCPEQTCDLTIKVSDRRVAITGIMGPYDRPTLNRVGEAIGGIRRLDISGVRSHINPFQREQGKYIEDHIRLDESSGSGSGDVRLARKIERFLETNLRCPEQTCDLTIKVSNGRVAIAGVISPEDRPLLEKVRQNIGGIRSLDLSGVRSHINPFQRDQI